MLLDHAVLEKGDTGNLLNSIHKKPRDPQNTSWSGPVRIGSILTMDDPAASLVTAFARVLRRHRTARGMAQEELAHSAGLSPRYVSLLEAGKHRPSLLTMARLAARLETPLSELIREAEAERDGPAA